MPRLVRYGQRAVISAHPQALTHPVQPKLCESSTQGSRVRPNPSAQVAIRSCGGPVMIFSHMGQIKC